ncbi:palladin-like [Sturnira hondurensis]|uniref:palladin-like n=1 Tax=Sturnira hondurensis TaxID=192404 RepID=UPI001879D94E|nr:palladin-like [Sturnira hondurensis]
MSETSSHDSFYDSLSDMQEESKNADCFPELSAFLSQEEINKSLDLARRAIANSDLEDFDSEKEISQIFNTSPISFCENSSRKETKLGEPASSGRPLDQRPEEQTEHTSSPGSKRRPAASPLLARPSYIRSLRKAEKRGAKVPNTGVKPKPAHQGKTGPQSQLCDKAANFIEELTSIFKEASKPRSRSPNGESSSPDSGYLSPKNQPSALVSVSASSQSPTEDQQEMEAEMKLPEARHCYGADQDEVVPGNSISHPRPQNALHFPSAPRFIQKLRSQEVAEGSRVYLECRVAGNPTPRVSCLITFSRSTHDPAVLCQVHRTVHEAAAANADISGNHGAGLMFKAQGALLEHNSRSITMVRNLNGLSQSLVSSHEVAVAKLDSSLCSKALMPSLQLASQRPSFWIEQENQSINKYHHEFS